MAYSEEIVNQVRDANDIVSVVGQYVKLTKKGANYFGLCPFHGEKTASFSVSPRKQIYYCFGCHKGGGVVNFIMEIPVASASTPSACAVSESLDCVLVNGEGTLDVPNCLKVASPTKVGKVVFNCTEVKSFTNPADGSVVEIPTAYIAEAESFLPAGTAYDPWADYDHDGVSNYAEYLAGTIPFDETDYLRVREFGPKGGKLALKFEHVGGHVYAVSSANTLAQPAWAKKRVRKDANGAELDQVVADDADGDPGLTEIFITPANGATSEFYKLEAK